MNLDNYTGHKATNGLYQKIINQIPVHQRYVELCAGSGAICSLLAVLPDEVILNDLNPEVQSALQIKFRSVTVINDCAISILKQNISVWNRETFIYIDPPYLHSTRPNSTSLYDFEMTDEQHVQLLSAALESNSNIMIQHPKCELYDTMLQSWRKVEIKVRYHRKTSIEILYMNYDENTELQSYAYLGNDCWDRQRIKRKGDNFIAKLSKLPVLEKRYILDRLKELE